MYNTNNVCFNLYEMFQCYGEQFKQLDVCQVCSYLLSNVSIKRKKLYITNCFFLFKNTFENNQ